MKTFIFAPATYNLAEVTRMIEIAKACRDKYNCIFIGYGGDYENIIEENNFEYIKMEPRLTPEKIEHLYKIDKGEKEGELFSKEEILVRVNNEIALYAKLKPSGIVSGFCLSVYLSSKVAKIPLISVMQSTWTREYFSKGLGTWPDILDFSLLRFIPEGTLNEIGSKSFLFLTKLFIISFNKAAKELGIKKFRDLADFLSGDIVLLAEPEGFSEITSKDLPSNHYFIGPLIGRLDSEMPDEVLNIPGDLPVIYFAMGSSGTPEIIAKIIEGFKDKPYRVISPVKSLVEKLNVKVPDNVIITDWLPAHKVNPMANLSLIHGGVGTVMTACLSGTPIVGVAMQPEQEANLECLVRKGFAIRIKKKQVTPESIFSAIDRMIDNKEAIRKAKEFQKIMEQWDDLSNIVDIFDY
ncbi:MAG: nucleotide disphospho-sugar-binding domain-containing protein [Cyanobacteriota bacterium]